MEATPTARSKARKVAARGGCEPFRAQSQLAAVGAFIDRTLAGAVGTVLPADARLMQRGVADLVEASVRDALLAAAAAASSDALRAERAKTKRSMEDLRIETGGATVYVDVKTRDLGGEFSMPNIVSIDRLEQFYRSGMNVFVVLGVEYEAVEGGVRIRAVSWRPIEAMCWSALAIQNIGKGQLQVRDARRAVAGFEGDRTEWMRRLYSEGASFYGRLAAKASGKQALWSGMAPETI